MSYDHDMEKGLRIVSVWEDDDLFEVRVHADNGKFSGGIRCYSTRESIHELALNLLGFPKQMPDNFQYSMGQDDISYFSIELNTTGGSGKLVARVLLKEVNRCSNAQNFTAKSEFDIPTEPASVDIFAAQLLKLSDSRIGESDAFLACIQT